MSAARTADKLIRPDDERDLVSRHAGQFPRTAQKLAQSCHGTARKTPATHFLTRESPAFDQQDTTPRPCQLDRGRRASRPGPDNRYVHLRHQRILLAGSSGREDDPRQRPC